ncbi:MAG: hypothetical protein L3J35_07255 [Bacteroidales bacterium]|nr:hypothetical protein [Bacteroidales bacterium]
MKHNFAIFLIAFRKEFFAGGRNTTTDNISDVDIFFIIGLCAVITSQ